MKKLLLVLVLSVCLLVTGTAGAAMQIPEGVDEYYPIGANAIVVTSGAFTIPDDSEGFSTAGGYLLPGLGDYADYYNGVFSVKKFGVATNKNQLKATPEKPAIYFRVPSGANGKLAGYVPVPWWQLKVFKGMDHKEVMLYADAKTGDLLAQPIRNDGLAFARPRLDMSLSGVSLEFNPTEALDFVGLVTPGLPKRLEILEGDTIVEITPTLTIKIIQSDLDRVSIEQIDLFGEVTKQVAVGEEMAAGNKYRIKNRGK